MEYTENQTVRTEQIESETEREWDSLRIRQTEDETD